MIRPELRRKYYGPAWQTYRLALIRAHGPVCMACGRETLRYLNFLGPQAARTGY